MPSRFHASVIAHIEEHAHQNGEKCALIVADRNYTYAELWERSCAFSSLMGNAGIQKGDRVLLQATHSFEYVVAYFATMLLGAIAVPFEEKTPLSGIKNLSDRVEANAIVASSQLNVDLPLFSFSDVESAQGNPCIRSLLSGDDLAELLLTTGTTGRSKIVALSQSAIMAVVENIVTATEIEGDNVSIVPMPLNHVFALRRLQTGLVVGGTVVLMSGVASLKRFFGALNNHGVTSLSLVPSALAFIRETTKDYLAKYDGQIRFVESSSAPLPSATRTWLRTVLPSARLYNSYGCTESTACCMLEYSKRDDDGPCVGSPCATASIQILDPQSGAALKSGAGRIAIGGSGVMLGYWDDKDATDSVLHNGMVYTNDLGYLQDGELYVRGRIDDVAIIGGHNVSPVEVEDVISCFDLVTDCACIKGSSPVTGDLLGLYVVWKDGVNTLEGQAKLLEFMRGNLEPFKIPSEVHAIKEIPRTYNGKIDRKVLSSIMDKESEAGR